MRIFNIIFAILFTGFAALQYNDPDPFLWILIYIAMVAVCVLAIRNQHYKYLTYFLALFYLVYAAILSPSIATWLQSNDRSMLFDDLAKMQYPYIEKAREFLGLIICLAVLAINYLTFKKSPS